MSLTNLSKRGPWIRSEKPVRRPSATARWHVLDISNEQAMCVCVVTDHSKSRSTSPTEREFVGGIDAQSSSAVCSRGVSISFGGGSVDILNVSARRIASSIEVELVKEALRRVIIDYSVRCDSWRSVSVTENAIRSTLCRYKRKK